jgi:phosphoribosylaminoimidazole carboxylase (NCAIR synthetase)
VSKNYLIQPLITEDNLLLTLSVVEGKIMDFQIAARYTHRGSKSHTPICLGTVYPSKNQEELKSTYYNRLSRLLRYINFENGILTIECFLKNNTLLFSDPGARLSRRGS